MNWSKELHVVLYDDGDSSYNDYISVMKRISKGLSVRTTNLGFVNYAIFKGYKIFIHFDKNKTTEIHGLEEWKSIKRRLFNEE